MSVLTRFVVFWLLGACTPAADLTHTRRQPCVVPEGTGPAPLMSPAECARRGGQSLYFASAAPEESVIHETETEGTHEDNWRPATNNGG